MAYQAIKNDLIYPLITNEQRKEYLNLLEQCQIQAKINDFVAFLYECQAQSVALISE